MSKAEILQALKELIEGGYVEYGTRVGDLMIQLEKDS